MLRDAVLVGYVRTPFGRADPRRGVFRSVRSDDLAVAAIQELLRRAALAPTTLPLALPARVQLRNSDGACFESRFDAAVVNESTRFRAVGF